MLILQLAPNAYSQNFVFFRQPPSIDLDELLYVFSLDLWRYPIIFEFGNAMSFERNYLQRLVIDLKTVAQEHQRLLLSGFVCVSVLATGAAFAVANLPNDSSISVQQITESIPAPVVSADALLENKLNLNLYNSTELQAFDTVNSVLKRLAVQDTHAADFLRSDSKSQLAFKSPGRIIKAEINGLGILNKLEIKWVEGQDLNYQRLTVLKTQNGWSSEIVQLPLQVDVRYRATTINSTLFSATDDAQIPDSVAVQLADIFSGDIDFQRSLRKGDRFAVIYQVFMAEGDLMRSGRVIAADYASNGKSIQALWFEHAAEPGSEVKGAYYTADGKNMNKPFLASPLAFSRVSSGFSMRFHPILQKWKAHLGTDYAAPIGTAVKVVGKGVVEFAGVQNGFGNVIYVKHADNKQTVYAHLSQISVKKGQTVSQGDVVGAVGMTGWATGPHLHFEFRVNGQHVDPLVIVSKAEAISLPESQKGTFSTYSQQLLQQLSYASQFQVASAQ